MKKQIYILTLLAIMALAMTAGAQTKLARFVITTGGISSSESGAVKSAAGQPVVGEINSGSLIVKCGFLVGGEIVPPPLPGDANGDGRVDVGDAVFLINFIFKGGAAPVPLSSGDANCDGTTNVGDAVFIINYVFKGGPEPCSKCQDKTGTKDEAKPVELELKLRDMDKTEKKATLELLATNPVDIAGSQITFDTDKAGVKILDVKQTERTGKIPLYQRCDKSGYRMGLIDLAGVEMIKAGSGLIATVEVDMSDIAADLEELRVKEAIFADATGQVVPTVITYKLEDNAVPDVYGLDQSSPNPFNPSTTIRYSLADACDVKITVFNVLGQTVKVLVDEYQDAGNHAVIWDGKDRNGHSTASGVYMYRMETKAFTSSKKMILLK